MIEWHTERRRICDLKPFDKNPRILNDKQYIDLKASLQKFNLAEIPAINTDGRICAGHQRLKILAALGRAEEEIDVRIPNRPLTDAEFEEYNLRSNKNTGEWDFALLADFGEDLLKDVGFDSSELDKIFKMTERPDADDVPEVRTTDIKRGDLFQLGKHRLLCGDSTQKADVERLMDGKKADMMFTSPPYNLGVSAKLRGNTVIGNRGNAYEDYDDAQDENCWLDLMNGFTINALDFAEYVFINVQSLAGNRTALWSWVNAFAKQFCDVAIWDKGHSAPQLAHRVMNSVFEMIFVFKKEKPSRAIGQKDYRGTVNNVFRIPPQRKNEFSDVHGATFPVELPQTIIETFTNREGTVLDLFLGSGSTLIATQETNRRCFGMEIDPHYCEIICQRYENFTGDKRVKL